jgi:hypothetical protein
MKGKKGSVAPTLPFTKNTLANYRKVANAKRSTAQKGVPKAEAMERARTKCTRTSETPDRHAKAAAAGVNAGSIARVFAAPQRVPRELVGRPGTFGSEK